MNLNLYGDKKKILSHGRGSDISSQRVDDLDKAAVKFACSAETNGCFIDVGCGFPIQASRFSLLGHDTLAIDMVDFSADIDRINEVLAPKNLRFLCKSIEDLNLNDLPDVIACFFSQRTIHYLHPNDASSLIKTIGSRMPSGAKAFVSASGIFSELSENYEGCGINWSDRHAPLSIEMQSKHGIEGNVCLYSEDDLSQLFLTNGFSLVSIFSSSFGNIKGTFQKN